jgi:transposase InsO family protein
VKTMCRVLAVSESGYYAWCKREPSYRQRENERLSEQIRQAYEQGRQVYGSPRGHAELQAQGIICGKHRVARLMRQADLRAVQKGHPGLRRAGCTWRWSWMSIDGSSLVGQWPPTERKAWQKKLS